MKLFIAVIALSLYLLSPVFGICKENGTGEETTLTKIMEKENIEAMNYWSVGDETILCVVTLHMTKMEDTSYPKRMLTFYKKKGDKLIKIYKFEPGDWFLTMYPLREVDGNLVTIWGGGSAYHFYVFSFINKEIKLALEDGSKLMPEIVDIDNDGSEEILISTESWKLDEKGNRILAPDVTRIYKWDNKSYKLIKTAPWKARLNIP